jgi:hypothetical protein
VGSQADPAIAPRFFSLRLEIMSNDSLVPKNTSYKAKQNHDSVAWLRFGRKCQKNPHMRKTIRERDNNQCRWCLGLIKDHQEPVLHHVDYDHVCTFAGDVCTYSPTAKRPQRMFNGPDCRKCEIENVDGFNACVSRLALVHSYCNFEISKRK